MSRIHRWAGTVEEMTDQHVHVVMRETPSGDIEMWTIPQDKFPAPPQHGDIVRIRICPRRLRLTLTDRQGRTRP